MIGAGVMKNTSRVVDHAALYAASPLKSTNTSEIELACQPNAASKQLHFESRYARSYVYQWLAVQYRFYVFHWRNVPFNLTRLSLLTFLGQCIHFFIRDIDIILTPLTPPGVMTYHISRSFFWNVIRCLVWINVFEIKCR